MPRNLLNFVKDVNYKTNAYFSLNSLFYIGTTSEASFFYYIICVARLEK